MDIKDGEIFYVLQIVGGGGDVRGCDSGIRRRCSEVVPVGAKEMTNLFVGRSKGVRIETI